MASLSIASVSSPQYSFTFPVMVAGVTPNGAIVVPNFFPSCSNVVGVTRTTAGGVVGAPYLSVPLVVAGATPQPTLRSANAGDLSIYTMYWYNQVAVSPAIAMLPC